MQKGKQKDVLLLSILIIILFAINYPFLDNALQNFLIDYKVVQVKRVIDGDTIIADNKSIRLLGINSPERGELYYNEAKEYLENLILNKTIRLEFGKEKTDMYNRILAYIHYNNKNINLELVQNGYANIYFPSGKDKYYNKFKNAWEDCTQNLCEKSECECGGCIELKEFNHKDEIITLYNSCNFNCDLTDWTIKDEGRKKFIFPDFILESQKEVIIKVGEGVNSNIKLFWTGETYVWTRTGDSLFLRDAQGGLVLWRSY